MEERKEVRKNKIREIVRRLVRLYRGCSKLYTEALQMQKKKAEQEEAIPQTTFSFPIMLSQEWTI